MMSLNSSLPLRLNERLKLLCRLGWGAAGRWIGRRSGRRVVRIRAAGLVGTIVAAGSKGKRRRKGQDQSKSHEPLLFWSVNSASLGRFWPNTSTRSAGNTLWAASRGKRLSKEKPRLSECQERGSCRVSPHTPQCFYEIGLVSFVELAPLIGINRVVCNSKLPRMK